MIIHYEKVLIEDDIRRWIEPCQLTRLRYFQNTAGEKNEIRNKSVNKMNKPRADPDFGLGGGGHLIVIYRLGASNPPKPP